MLITVYRAIDYLLVFIQYAIFARVIVSWLPISRNNSIIRLLYQITEPILAPLRGIIERSPFGRNMIFDFSPVLAFILIGLIRNIIFRTSFF
ncbi:MAG: YggT family protein [Clostridiaceae bacterium]|nr:YggT family protein [Clostridiaceae bacterium]